MARTKTPSLYEAKWTAATRKAYQAEHPANFAGPDGSYPIKDRSDVGDAWGLAGHAENPDAVRRKIIAIAKRLGFTDALPDPAKDFMKSDGKEDDDKKESTPSESVSITSAPSSSAIRPRERIATIQVCWIEDNARSLNGRIYPTETVDRLISSGQRKIADLNALPITCFLSHADADNDHTPALIGRATKIWREGSKGMALIDLADTQPSRDALGLLIGKYIRTESLRASNAELRTDSRYDVPVVGGNAIELDGIDLTNYPGLEACARVQQIQIAESANQKTPITEVFDITPQAVSLHEVYSQKDASMTKIQEAEQGGNTVGGYQSTSGNTVGTTNDPTQDSYGQSMYKAPELTTGQMQGMTNAPELMEAHDRIAMVQNRSCAPGRESARWKAAYSKMSEAERQSLSLSEAGKKLSSKNDAHLDAAHHAIAKHCAMECEGANNKMTSNDPDNDGDDDSTNDPQKNPDFALDQMESTTTRSEKEKKGSSPMSKDEALRLLEEAGYDTSSLQKKKTEAELLNEQIEAMKAEQAKQIEEMRALIANALKPAQQQSVTEDAPQRRSLVNDAAHTTSTNPRSIRGQLYKHGQYLQEKIRNTDWEQLADRTCPLPEDLEIDHLIKEFEQLYAVQYDDRFKILSATELR